MFSLATVLALILVFVGPGAAYFHLVSPTIAVGLTVAGMALLAVFFFVSVLKIFLRESPNWIALVFGFFSLVAIGVFVVFGFLNPLYDVSTDLKNPPAFQHPAYPFIVNAGGEYLDESLRLHREFNPLTIGKHRELYPTFVPITVKVPAKEAYAAILKVVQTQFPTWKIVLEDPVAYRLEAEVAEPVFGLITDVAIEVRSEPEQEAESTIVMRSRLRTILTDLGWDASVLQNLRAQINFVLENSEDKTPAKSATPPPQTKAAQPVAPAPTPPAAVAPTAPAVPLPAKLSPKK